MANRIANGSLVVVLAALGAASCEHAPTSIDARGASRPSFATAAGVITAMRGRGAIGSGQPTYYGVDHQWFALDVGSSGGVVYGTLDYIDSGFVKGDGNYPHFVVGPDWPGTAVATFVQTSSTCVEFDGVGRLINTGELLAFRAAACDTDEPGVGLDVFGIEAPQRLVTNGDIYRAGPLALWHGEVTASSATTPVPASAPTLASDAFRD
jgi:hypothetical protein